MNPNTMAQDAILAHAQHRAHQANFLKSNPKVNKSLWIFGPYNPIRRVCQLVVAPSRGERFEGSDPNPIAWWIFSAITYLAIICIVVLACITTPIYQIEYFQLHGENKFNWITWSDIAFAVIFSVEAVIKIIADGFLFTPNAYIRNVWNDIDFFVLITLWINVVADLTDRGSLSRAFRAFKALRALRLVNISETARETFHDVIISGFWNIMSAAVVAMSLLIPYAIWGLNIFNGLLFYCNDGSDGINKPQCNGEYLSSPQNWNVLAPRSWANPEGYNFDDFGSSLSILFEIVSQEGWINVLTSAMAIVGPDQNPRIDASPLNAIFFVAFNLLGAVFVLTLFISVIITNYTKRSGVAYMTADQRSWQELRKVLLQLRPSKRPTERPEQSWRAWCYDRAISKHGFWTRTMTGIYTFHVILLTLEIYPSPDAYSLAQEYLFLVLSLIYVVNIAVRMVGLGTYHYFRSMWDVYDIVMVTGALGTTVALLAKVNNNVFLQFQKLFLVAIAFNLIPKNDALDQLFKTAASSLPTIASLLCIWLVLFVVYAIAFTQIFGLTRLGPNGTGSLNFRTIPNALVVLFRMSVGYGFVISNSNCLVRAGTLSCTITLLRIHTAFLIQTSTKTIAAVLLGLMGYLSRGISCRCISLQAWYYQIHMSLRLASHRCVRKLFVCLSAGWQASVFLS
jgi:voltage-dependent calcium channel